MDSAPGFYAIKETEEHQIWASGPDNNHSRYHAKAEIKSTVVDSGNTPTTTLRGGFLLGRKDSDSLDYVYDPDGNDGTQGVVGILEKALSMLDKDGTVENKFTRMLTSGIIKDTADLIGFDKQAAAILLRMGFRFAAAVPHGSAFLVHPRRIDFKAADYTVVDGDHGKMLVATAAVNFTLPTLATVGPGFEVLLYQAADANLVITGAADTILYGDAGGAASTTLTFSTANKKMGAQALMKSGYASAGGALAWFPLFLPTTVTSA